MSEENKPDTVPSVDDVVLLPCPFCGGEAVYESRVVVFHSEKRFRCKGCGVRAPWSPETPDIYRHWNKRHSPEFMARSQVFESDLRLLVSKSYWSS